MPVTSISLEVEDIEFIAVLRVLHNLPGVARVNFDLDSLGKKNRGGAAKPNGRPGMKPIILGLMINGPVAYGDMKRATLDAGYKPTSLSQALNELRRSGMVRNGPLGWSLTPRAEAQIKEAAAQEGQASERLALPPPEPPPTQRRKRLGDPWTSALVILATLKAAAKPLHRSALREAVVARKFSPGSIDGAMARLKKAGHIEPVGEGIVKITKEGGKVKLPSPKEE